MGYILIFIFFVLIGLVGMNVRVVPQSQSYVIERFGAFQATWKVGVNFTVPFVDVIASKVSLKERIDSFMPQPVITKDNVTLEIDAVVSYQVTDAKPYTYGVNDPQTSIETLTTTALVEVVSELDFAEVLDSRSIINTKIRSTLEESTRAWGIKINRVETKNIQPPKELEESTRKRKVAETNKEEAILIAEGDKRAQILRAQGEKESQVIIAQGYKEASILKAEGEATATLNIQRAKAHGYKFIKAAGADQSVVALRSLEALEKLGDGKATKIIVPSDIQDIASLVAGISEVSDTDIDIPIDDKKSLTDGNGNKL